jgi:hypothetical protein
MDLERKEIFAFGALVGTTIKTGKIVGSHPAATPIECVALLNLNE